MVAKPEKLSLLRSLVFKLKKSNTCLNSVVALFPLDGAVYLFLVSSAVTKASFYPPKVYTYF